MTLKGENEMKKKIIIGVVTFVFIGFLVSGGIIYASTNNTESPISETMESELFPTETIEDEDGDNLDVDMNNKLVEAMNDYTAGKISDSEYEKICKEIQKQIKKEGYDKLEEDEQEYQENVN